MTPTEKLIRDTFKAHQPIIGGWARECSDNFADVYRFVLATIQQPISTTPEIVASFKSEGDESKWAFGVKRDALRYIEEKAGFVYDTAEFIYREEQYSGGTYGALLSYFASLPGLGLIKGGFLAQLVYGEIGCLDTHNIERFGLNARSFAAYRFKAAKTVATRKAFVRHYLELCEACGGCALLWAEWCEYVAQRDNKFKTAEEVSRIHLTALGLSV